MASIQGIYIALFGRPADPVGLEFFNTATGNGSNLNAIGDLASTPEYQSRFQGLGSAEIVTAIYQSLFARNPEQQGLSFFVNALANGTFNINNVAIAILDGAQGPDLTIVQNKIAAASVFTSAINTADELAAYRGEDASDTGRAFITPVTVDPSTVPTTAAADAALQSIIDGPPVVGAQFVLTPGYDLADIAGSFRNGGPGDPGVSTDFKFTNIGETIVATQTTLGANDSLVDGSTTDNDRLTLALTGNLAFPVVTDVETLEVNANTLAATTLNLAQVTGATTLDLNGVLTGLLTVANIQTTGISVVDGSGLTSVAPANGFRADFSTAAGTLARDITGSGANDQLFGGDGNDTVRGGGGSDILYGRAGNDTVDGGDGDDNIVTDTGNDVVTGGVGSDSISGGAGDDTLDGGIGDDVLSGDADNDTVRGGDGNDIIYSYEGSDIVSGGVGNDTIFLFADTDPDTLVFEATGAGNGLDTIYTFQAAGAGADRLDVSAFLGQPVAFQALANNSIGAGGGGVNGVDFNVFIQAVDTDVNTEAEMKAAIGADASDLKLAANSKAVFGFQDAGGETQIYFVTTNALGEAAEVSLVGTLDTVVSAQLTATSFL